MAIKINNVTVIDDSKKIIPSSIEANSTVGIAGSVLTSTGSGLEWVPPTGGLTLISSVNANNSSSVAFTSGITTAYNSYVIYGYNIVGTAITNLEVIPILLAGFSTNSGSSYIGTDYYYINSGVGAAAGRVEYIEIPIPESIPGCVIPPAYGSIYGTLLGGNPYPINFVWHLHNLGESGNKLRHSSVQAYCGIGSTTVGAGYFHVGLGVSTPPINAIEFSIFGNPSDVIVSGNFRLCGINNS